MGCLKPPSPTLPPKGEGSLSILSFKIFTVDNFNYFVRLKLPPWGIEGAENTFALLIFPLKEVYYLLFSFL
jgi:hypothetical protein